MSLPGYHNDTRNVYLHLYLQIRRTSPLSDPTFLCIQYQLYGCMEMPTDCTPLISYDYSQPITRDGSYTGECKNNWCSGGLGILTDSNYSEFINVRLQYNLVSRTRLIEFWLIRTLFLSPSKPFNT